MQGTGRKNIVGGWLLRQMIGRALGAMSWAAGVIGFVSGCLVGSAPAVADSLQALGWWFPLGALSMVAITCVALALVMRAVQSTWGGGLAAERRVGDRIEHALVRPGCAFAHDVKEALGGSGNVDHVVLTPAGVWVVETKAGWLKKGPFKNALRQVGRERGTSTPSSEHDRRAGSWSACHCRQPGVLRVGSRLDGRAGDGVPCRIVLAAPPGGVRS